jgi:hypothetical protein
MQRIDTVAAKRWAEYVVRIQSGQDPRTEVDFHNNTVNPLSPQQEAAITALQWGSFELADYNWPNYGAGSIASTESNSSKGKELQLTYNPSRSWTIKWTVGQQEAQFSDVAPEAAEWEAFRKPMWEALGISGVVTGLPGGPFDFSQSYAKRNGNRLFLGSLWNGYGFTEGAAFNDANSNTAGAINTPATTYTAIT